MKGFFSKQETASKTRPDGKIYSCISCGGYKNCNTPKMEPQGNFEKKIMIIGSITKSIDDQKGKPFQGRAGKILQRVFNQQGIDIWEDCVLLNATRCNLTEDDDDRYPTNYEVECCRKLVNFTINKYKPKVIFLLGYSAMFSMIGNRWKKDFGKVEKWRGWCIPDQDYKAWLCPTYDPTFVDNQKGPEAYTVWENDIAEGLKHLDEPVPIHVNPEIVYLDDDLTPLNDIHDMIAFDYETTGLKPHAEGHKIICASVAVSENKVYTFMMPKAGSKRRPFDRLLSNPKIRKVAQNMKFEDTWSIVRLGVQVENWDWDTMLATHILDNRATITNLKFQVYVQFGIVDYDSEVSPYLKAKDETSANSINRIQELLEKPGGKKLLLKYCALDSIYEYRLARIQLDLILPF